MAGGDIRDAATRIFDQLSDEERRKRRLTTMMDRLRESGWVEPRPARPAQGPTVADAAGAIDARLNADDALRAEAERQLGTSAPASERTGPGFLRTTPGSGDTEEPTQDDAAFAADMESLRFKKDPELGPWRPAAYAMAKYIEVDPELAVAAGPDIVPVFAGARVYRNLDRRAQQEVMKDIQKLQSQHPELHGTLRGQVIAAVASPFQSPWSMSDDELHQHIQSSREFLDILDYTGDAEDVVGIGSAMAGASNIATKLTVPTAAASGYLLAIKYWTKGHIAAMERELERRRNGADPFEQEEP